jgi:L-serine dehydratase
MFISAFELFKVGIGPSSSHTVGPMRAARRFCERLIERGEMWRVSALRVSLHGSLAHTGKGHGTDMAILLGLEGEEPQSVDTDAAPARVAKIRAEKAISLYRGPRVSFDPDADLRFNRRVVLKLHSNGMVFQAFDESGALLHERTYFSVGGGFIVNSEGEPEAEAERLERPLPLEALTEAVDPVDAGGLGLLSEAERAVPYPFNTAAELLSQCEGSGLSISSLMLANESALRPEAEVRRRLASLWAVMQACIKRGCEREGILPGGLRVKRRAAALHRALRAERDGADPMSALDWVNLWALAVNEENAAGGRVVTAPTNGAAGIIPAVLSYYVRFIPNADEDGVARFLLVAASIASLYKKNASISGAEVGCQGEVGVACSMAAGALAEVMGGTPAQVCNSAEIGMEHNLGLTCDPWGGLVQVPCIERNAMGAVKAINAARLALRGDGSHKVSLDKVIETMRRTGADMSTKYKETARGGLALTVVEC